MRKNKLEKELRHRYGHYADSMQPYYHHLDLRPLSELDDDGFAFLMKNVKGVNMLDLNETGVSDKSIELLTQMEYVNELRAKGCRNITNDSIIHLGKITNLVFLHLKNTSVTLDGLLQLPTLPQLKELMFSHDGTEDITAKMTQLSTQIPGCAFTVNSIPWTFEKTDTWE